MPKFEHYGEGIAKGLKVTLKHLGRRPITTQYPDQKMTLSRRFRGYELVWYDKACTACGTCAKACPQGNIEIVSVKEGNFYRLEKLEVDTGRCMACGLCIEACPYGALYMGKGYERARYRRQEVVLTKETLRPSEERQPSGYANPNEEALLPKQTLLVERE